MAFENVSWIWRKGMYFLVWLVTALAVGWLYIGPLTNQANYNTFGWAFAVLFPVLVGVIVAVQVANAREQKTCPVGATSGGVAGSVLGIITVGCPMCPAILLGWIGLGAALPSSLLGGPWLKAASLVMLVAALYWASSEKQTTKGR